MRIATPVVGPATSLAAGPAAASAARPPSYGRAGSTLSVEDVQGVCRQPYRTSEPGRAPFAARAGAHVSLFAPRSGRASAREAREQGVRRRNADRPGGARRARSAPGGLRLRGDHARLGGRRLEGGRLDRERRPPRSGAESISSFRTPAGGRSSWTGRTSPTGTPSAIEWPNGTDLAPELLHEIDRTVEPIT